MNHKSALHHKLYNLRAQVSFATALPESLDSRLRGNDGNDAPSNLHALDRGDNEDRCCQWKAELGVTTNYFGGMT